MTAPFASLVEMLRHQATRQPESLAYIYVNEGDSAEVHLSFGELDRKARAVAAMLQAQGAPGKRALLLYPPDEAYLVGFFGCLYAGVVAVPAYPPDPARLNRTLPRLQSIVADAQADFILTTSEIETTGRALLEIAPDLAAKTWLATDTAAAELADQWLQSPADRDTIAFLQYTSGSTGDPRGVVLTHGNLLHNLVLISQAFGIDQESVGVSWLPPYHDMGLIGGILAPMFNGRPTVLMSPVAFLRRPARWLEAISRHRATISGGPNFAYELCVRKISSEEKGSLDLRKWRLAFSGAEPVQADTLRRFAEAFRPCGFDPAALYPCYGLAEATLIVTGKPVNTSARIFDADVISLQRDKVRQAQDTLPKKTLVSCGRALGEQEILVVSPQTMAPCRSAEIGEIWIRGPSVANGYWRRPEETTEVFQAHTSAGDGPYLRTGDLGFVDDGELFVTGRLKDLIIIRGRNHYPQDIERSAENSHPSVRRGCGAAFAIEVKGDESLIVAIEVERRHRNRRSPSAPPSGDQQHSERRRRDRRQFDVSNVDDVSKLDLHGDAAAAPFDPDEVCDSIREAILHDHDLHVYDIVLLQPGTIPKTSSGKIERRTCKSTYIEGTLDNIAHSTIRTHDETKRTSVRPADVAATVRAMNPIEQRTWLEHFLRDQVAHTIKTSASRVDLDRPVSRLGLDSLMAVDLAHRLEKRLGAVLTPTEFLRDVSLRQIALQLQDRLAESGADRFPAIAADAEMEISEAQEAFWYLDQLVAYDGHCNVYCAIRIDSPLDVAALQKTVEILLGRHAILTTCYEFANGRVVPRRAKATGAPLAQAHVGASELKERVRSEVNRRIQLSNEIPIRFALFTADDGSQVLTIVAHAICADTWSLVILLDELKTVYSALADRRPVPESPEPVTYADYARWLLRRSESPAGHADLDYWRDELRAEPPVLRLRSMRRRGRYLSHSADEQAFTIDATLTNRLRELAREEGVTLYVTLLTTLVVLLAREGARGEVAIGVPAAGRVQAQFERMIGCFVNPVVLRAELPDHVTFRELLAQLRGKVIDALDHQDYPFPRLLRQLRVSRNPSYHPLYQIAFSLEASHDDKHRAQSLVALGAAGARTKLGPLAVTSYPIESCTSLLDLEITMVEHGDTIHGVLRYNVALFDREVIRRFVEDFRSIATHYTAAPAAIVSEPENQAAVIEHEPASTGTQERDDDELGSPLERVIAAAWTEALGMDILSRSADFFDLGGQSLAAARIAARLQDFLAVDVPLSALFRTRTIAALAESIKRGPGGASAAKAAELLEEVDALGEYDAATLLETARAANKVGGA